MNKQRAQEIASSPVMANVSYKGDAIYIQHVDDKNETARIYALDQPENEQEVSLNDLKEDYR
ncbi:small acid-soluble spore protein H (minor) [Scopulibacillus darangshiensis]|uniref:Small acid-soluble spore protein H (Minor) n=1 Tax=Scopulibacillus darangshiensis TaxID=442528 RepID=A0A4R2P5V3_9BACL|nr:small acid-soluble spore protein H [Scopulibacillus darangshiensis]TCP29165.1 small acid-soluble spore protein H (minor) [Scopulibacillus darangshiensis]